MKIPPAIPPSAPWPRMRVLALVAGIVVGLLAAATVLVAAGYAEGQLHSLLAAASGVAGLWAGRYTYTGLMKHKARRPQVGSERPTGSAARR